MRESCAVFGIYAPGEDVATLTFFGLYALQHRGQESSGIAASDGILIQHYKEMGLVSQIFTPEILHRLRGHIAVGHNRYSTSGTSKIHNAQPILLKTHLGPIALSHNGNLINYESLRKELENKSVSFATNSDSEIIAKMFAMAEGENIHLKIAKIMEELKGAYSVVLCTKDKLVGFRDPLGVRPLCLGQLSNHNQSKWVISSESCALNTIGAEFIREIQPSEIVIIDNNGVKSYFGKKLKKHSLCIFEYIYFARPDSIFNGKSVYLAREKMGRILAKEYECNADIVMAVPDSALPAAIGFSKEACLPYVEGLIKNRYIARTFIQPENQIRKLGIKLKFNPVIENIKGKNIIIVDDSIVRGNTTKSIIALLKAAGAKEVHVRITSPPMKHPCFLGVDTATYEQLIAANKATPEIAQFIHAESLGYLSLKGLLEAVGAEPDEFCLACFNGKYPYVFEDKK